MAHFARGRPSSLGRIRCRRPARRRVDCANNNLQRVVVDAGQRHRSTMANAGMGGLIPTPTRGWTAEPRGGFELAFQANHPPLGESSVCAEMTGMPRAETWDGAALSTSDHPWRTSRTSLPPGPHLHPSASGPSSAHEAVQQSSSSPPVRFPRHIGRSSHNFGLILLTVEHQIIHGLGMAIRK